MIDIKLTTKQAEVVLQALDWALDYENQPKNSPYNERIHRIIGKISKELEL